MLGVKKAALHTCVASTVGVDIAVTDHNAILFVKSVLLAEPIERVGSGLGREIHSGIDDILKAIGNSPLLEKDLNDLARMGVEVILMSLRHSVSEDLFSLGIRLLNLGSKFIVDLMEMLSYRGRCR